MGNNHNHRSKKLCTPVKVESVTPQKITTEVGIYSQKVGEEMKTVSVGLGDSSSILAMIVVFIGGGYLLLGLLRMFAKRQLPWLSDRQFSHTMYYEPTEYEPLVKRVSMKPISKKCLPVPAKS